MEFPGLNETSWVSLLVLNVLLYKHVLFKMCWFSYALMVFLVFKGFSRVFSFFSLCFLFSSLFGPSIC